MQHEPGTNIVANGALATLSGASSTGRVVALGNAIIH